MCARRFLLFIFVMTLLVVASAFAIFQFGQDVLIKSATPKGHSVAPAAQAEPDYADPANWVSRPAMADDPALWLPEGVEPTAGNAAVFYIHPTTYLERDRWNAPMLPGGETEFRTRLFAQSQASAFNGTGRIWAPRYRQAAYGAFLLDNRDAAQAFDLAYRDVLAAFDRFLSEAPKDAPIILAGHSQGSLHLLRLLADRRDTLEGRLAAAYVIGWPVSTTADLPATGLTACAEPESTRCIVSYESFGEPANPSLILNAWEKSPGRSGAHRRGDIICVDPIGGLRDGASAPADNPGTLVPGKDLTTGTLEKGRVGGRCDKGIFLLSGAIPPLGPFVMPGNNYHVYDYALFWGAIRRDAERRLAAWRQ
jgi:hypothetical protein